MPNAGKQDENDLTCTMSRHYSRIPKWLQALFFLPNNNTLKVKLLQRLAWFWGGRSRAYYYREETVCICLQPGVAVSFFFFYPNKEVYFGFQIQSFSPPTLPPHGKSPNNIVLQTGTDILSKPAAESSLGLPGKQGKRGGHIMVINTSQNTEGIHVWACSAAYVDPAASLRSESAQAPTGISIIPS